MPESTQHKLDRIRPPRVQITYDVEIGDAIVMKELPFVVGIMADLSGDNKPEKPLKERKYSEIDRDNFNDIMYAIAPSLTLSVADKLGTDPNSTRSVPLTFRNLDDFSPINIVKQVPELNDLFDARTRLADLSTKLDGNDKLEKAINNALYVGDATKKLDDLIEPSSTAGQTPAAPAGDGAAKDAKAAAAADKPGKAAADAKAAETPAAPAPQTGAAKPLTAKERREKLQQLLNSRKTTADFTAAKTYYDELKAAEKKVADAEKELKDLREKIKRKARLEGRELPQDGGSDDE